MPAPASAAAFATATSASAPTTSATTAALATFAAIAAIAAIRVARCARPLQACAGAASGFGAAGCCGCCWLLLAAAAAEPAARCGVRDAREACARGAGRRVDRRGVHPAVRHDVLRPMRPCPCARGGRDRDRGDDAVTAAVAIAIAVPAMTTFGPVAPTFMGGPAGLALRGSRPAWPLPYQRRRTRSATSARRCRSARPAWRPARSSFPSRSSAAAEWSAMLDATTSGAGGAARSSLHALRSAPAAERPESDD